MNKTLLEKVMGMCKDTGLSEKHLTALTEKMGGSVADDSTDNEAIESAANLISEVAKATQAEATRWVNASKKKDPDDPKKEEGKGEEDTKPRQEIDENKKLEERFKALENKLAEYEAKDAKRKRSEEIEASMERHGIPYYMRERFGRSISDDEDIEAVISGLKQEMITNGLVDDNSEGAKTASEKQIEEAAGGLLESIKAK